MARNADLGLILGKKAKLTGIRSGQTNIAIAQALLSNQAFSTRCNQAIIANDKPKLNVACPNVP